MSAYESTGTPASSAALRVEDRHGAGSARDALLAAARDELVAHGASGVSLRAVARRAGVSHAAPKHHFGDRAGLLTVVAADGHRRLAAALRGARDEHGDPETPELIARLGRMYLDFGLAEPALFELMFRSDELHPEDLVLMAAREESLGVLVDAVQAVRGVGGFGADAPVDQLALISWAFVHGLVVLVRDGALEAIATRTGTDPQSSQSEHPDGALSLAHTLTDTFIHSLADSRPRARSEPTPP
jgi:AcrR family transcriptional regulator